MQLQHMLILTNNLFHLTLKLKGGNVYYIKTFEYTQNIDSKINYKSAHSAELVRLYICVVCMFVYVSGPHPYGID